VCFDFGYLQVKPIYGIVIVHRKLPRMHYCTILYVILKSFEQ